MRGGGRKDPEGEDDEEMDDIDDEEYSPAPVGSESHSLGLEGGTGDSSLQTLASLEDSESGLELPVSTDLDDQSTTVEGALEIVEEDEEEAAVPESPKKGKKRKARDSNGTAEKKQKKSKKRSKSKKPAEEGYEDVGDDDGALVIAGENDNDSDFTPEVTPVPTPAKERKKKKRDKETEPKTAEEICAMHGLNNVEIEYTDEDYETLTHYKAYTQTIRPLICAENPKMPMSKIVSLIGAKWREFLATHPNRELIEKSKKTKAPDAAADDDLELDDDGTPTSSKSRRKGGSAKKTVAPLKIKINKKKKKKKVPTATLR